MLRTENVDVNINGTDNLSVLFLYTSAHNGDYIQGHLALLSLRYIMIYCKNRAKDVLYIKKNRRNFTASSIQNNTIKQSSV